MTSEVKGSNFLENFIYWSRFSNVKRTFKIKYLDFHCLILIFQIKCNFSTVVLSAVCWDRSLVLFLNFCFYLWLGPILSTQWSFQTEHLHWKSRYQTITIVSAQIEIKSLLLRSWLIVFSRLLWKFIAF